ncbi:hypothetical protein EVB41_073 [Rhizobium phage RHph_TM3_14A]|nr:hypothetical protein EVB29_074 [Rhizobium phage RHph_TM27A]QIG66994.1 hypothetical protein EVB30_074 [Rhizobium phage RHph_TM27B]QIG67082.1 hypothetical protein EVB31_072 [Rhizobium phage RHph_TM29]QIG67538.1 hypothetical protein EVB41_073 [Rhizobium phage RHph_TM3_14A]
MRLKCGCEYGDDGFLKKPCNTHKGRVQKVVRRGPDTEDADHTMRVYDDYG